jgi:outer membrane protein insertion porin family
MESACFTYNSFGKVLLRLVFPFAVMLSGCSTTKTLGEDEKLFTGHEVEIVDKPFLGKIGMKGEIKGLTEPPPNNKLMGLFPLGLWFYNLAGDSVPEKGFRHWVQEKLGEPPVVYKPYFTERTENNIQDYLFSKGYFDSDIRSDIKTDDKKVKSVYTIETKERYTLDTIVFPDTTDSLSKYINVSLQETLLEAGKGYDLEVLKEERERISSFLRNNGFYYFAPNYLIFELDSNGYRKEIDLYLTVKPSIPQRARQMIKLNNIYINSDYSVDGREMPKDTVVVDSMYFFFRTKNVKPSIVSRSIMFDPGQLYQHDSYINSLNKLSGLGIYKFTNINFENVASDSSLLDANVFLTQSVPKSLRAELQAVTKSNQYMGPEVSLSYSDKNFLRGAELFSLNLNSSFETQISKEGEAGNSIEVGMDVNLSVPRFIFPFVDLNKYLSDKYTPKTNMQAGYNFYFRTRYFRMNTFYLNYGYSWRESVTNSHEFKILNLNYSRISSQTPAFREILENNPLVRSSFNEELILSLIYTFTFNNQLFKERKMNSYFTINPELAGNTLSLVDFVATGSFPTASDPARALGIKFSQYAKIDADYRAYFNLGQNSKLVGRLFAGFGKAYGNSNIMPFVKQYYIGGASDLRAFRTHTVGPGTYFPPDTLKNSYFEQVGDVKLEGNLEYRFGIFKLVKGALFIDAGNIWLLGLTGDKEEGKLHWGEILDELAIGSGFGLRLDASVFVLRLDLGFPLRKPWLPQGQRWVMDDIDPGKAKWRRNNLVLNIAIGYPF